MNNIPAFPSVDAHDVHYKGMTLKDYFAVHATYEDFKYYINEFGDTSIARYTYANKMLEARKK